MDRVHNSPLPDVPTPGEALTPVVFRHADRLQSQPAFIDGPEGRTVTYGDLLDRVYRFAGALASRGIGRGDVIGIMAPNLPEYAIVFHGTATVGAIITPINPTYTSEEVAFQLNDAGARLLVTIPPFLEVARQGAAGSAVTEIVVIGEAEGATSLASMLECDPVSGQVPIDPHRDLAVLPYSSGTTGLPKGVMLTHHNLVANLAQCDHVLQMNGDDRVIAVLPFFHIYGMQILMNGVLFFGATAVTMPRFDLAQFLGLLQDHQITQAFLVPPIILALAKHPLVDDYDLGALKRVVSAAAPLGADLAEAAAGRIDTEVVQGYGLTETSPVTHLTPPGQGKPGSIGVTISNTECRIVDPETGADLGIDRDGEIWVRGPQVMAGYLNNPEATALTIDGDGWLHTGDIGHVDADGHFFIVDRLKELIKYKGFQVPPAELEALLLAHPAVADAAVIPVPDLEAGELPKAFVVLETGHDAGASEIMEFVAGHVAHYKQIRQLEFLEEIPKSASGKILRRVLRDLEADSQT